MTLEKEKIEALETIIRESERLRDLAKKANEGMLGFLLENVLHEARSVLINAGHQPPSPGSSDPAVLPFKPR